ncbi:hypothetical protein [Aquipuribacter nitratireducens]|uniref:EcsC family protein n=1 Tax=Aquipuribacter nitratireducens TaxID=650104 RepID=A0ABW0GJQ3_9MICO
MSSRHGDLLAGMSAYELQRWNALTVHWEKKSRPPAAFEKVTSAARQAGSGAARGVDYAVSRVPDGVQRAAGRAADLTLRPVADAAVELLDLVATWTARLMDPEEVLSHHRERSRDVGALNSLALLDMQELDEVTRRMPLHWRTVGAGEGAAMGALALVPVAGIAAAVTLDVLVVHALSNALATRTLHAYGFDDSAEEYEELLHRIVRGSLHTQVEGLASEGGKTATFRASGKAFEAIAGRQRWSMKLRTDHRLIAATEKLLKTLSTKPTVSVSAVSKAIPVVSIVTGAGLSAAMLGATAKNGIRHGQTVRLVRKYGLDFPPGYQPL